MIPATYPGQQRRQQLADVDLPHRERAVREELPGASLALTDDGVGAHGRRNRERNDDGDRCEEVDGERVLGPRARIVALDVLLEAVGQGSHDLADLRDQAVLLRTTDRAPSKKAGQHHEEHPGQQHQRDPVVP